MGRKSKYSAAFKLMIIHEAEASGITKTSRKYSLSDHTIRTWKLISSGRNRLFQQETCLCVKKRPDRRTVPQSSRILLVEILYLNCILDRT